MWSGPWHCPIALVVDVHASGVGQELPLIPRHPCSQACVVELHTRPDVDAPQFASVAHPHVSDARQADPTVAALQNFV